MIDKRVLPLTLGGLALGTTEFTIMGLLPDLAKSLNCSIPQAGHLIAAYAVGVVVGAPLLIGYSVRFPPKKVLLAVTLLIVLFNGFSALAPDYNSMMIARFLSGLPHGAFFGVGTVIASRLAGPGKEARYISLMFTGLTVANLAMVPLVTFIGHVIHWRVYFASVSLIGLIAFVSIIYWLPAIGTQQQSRKLSSELSFLKNSQSWYVLLITAIGFGGLFAWLSYISPLMTTLSGVGENNMAYVMVLVGGGMVVGNLAGGYLSDKIGAIKTNTILLGSMMLSLIGVFFLSEYTSISLVLTFFCGALSMAVAAPVNILMMKAAPNAEMMAAAFMQAAFNVANALGAYLGGVPLEYGFPFNYPALVGVGMSFIGLIICLAYTRRFAAFSSVAIES